MRRPRLTPDRDADLHTVSGVPVYLDRPFQTGILARDLRAHAVGGVRYNGAPAVTILAHSVLVAALAEDAGESVEVVQHAAAHDLAEAIPLGEVVTGLKRRLPNYKALEEVWEPRIRVACGLSYNMPPAIKRQVKVYDRRAFVCELWWFNHPMLSLFPKELPTPRERWLTAMVFLPVVGSVWMLWRRVCRWLPNLRSKDVL